MSFLYANSVCTFGANPNYTRCFFMNSKEIKEVVLLLNTSQASKNIDNLKNKLEETRRLKEEAFNKGDDKAFKKLGQEEQKSNASKARLHRSILPAPYGRFSIETHLHNYTPTSDSKSNGIAPLHPTVDSQSKPTCRPAPHVRFEIERHYTTAPYGRFSIETYLQTCTLRPIRNRTAWHTEMTQARNHRRDGKNTLGTMGRLD